MSKVGKVSLLDLENLAAARNDDRSYKVRYHHANHRGPLWHGIVRHPKKGLLQIVDAEYESPEGDHYQVAGELSRRDAAVLLVGSMWDHEVNEAGIMPYTMALRWLNDIRPVSSSHNA